MNTRILLIAGAELGAGPTRAALENEGFEVRVVPSAAAAMVELKGVFAPSLAVIDLNMPDLNTAAVLKNLRARSRYVSTIFICNLGSAASVLNAGADDCICMPVEVKELVARVHARLRTVDLGERLAAENERLLQLIDVDDLTGLSNMRSIFNRLDHELVRATRFNRSVATVMMDVDDFKLVNDRNDHLFGSHVLRELGGLIRETIRKVDIAARFGGDEFLIILPETGIAGAMIFAERLRVAIEKHLFANATSRAHVTASFGVAASLHEDRPISGTALIRGADLALYEAKAAGKNRAQAHGAAVDEQRRSAS